MADAPSTSSRSEIVSLCKTKKSAKLTERLAVRNGVAQVAVLVV